MNELVCKEIGSNGNRSEAKVQKKLYVHLQTDQLFALSL